MVAIGVVGCSSTPALPNNWTLKTKPLNQSYYYCESCPQATKLSSHAYQPLEPDDPVIEIKQVSEPRVIKIKNVRSPKKHKKHRVNRKKLKNKPKQCIQWS